MNKYGQYCPAARAAEILGDRWTLLIVRDLLCGAQHFNELERGLPGIPKALLSARLQRLQDVGVLERREGSGRKCSYHLTDAGRALQPVMDAFIQWGSRWAFGEPDPAELNPVLLLWWMRDGVDSSRLPRQRVVVEFVFQEVRPARYWLVIKPGDVTVCVQHPGFEVDVLVSGELSALYQVWLGRLAFGQALRERRLELEAIPALRRAFPSWFLLSPTAVAVRAAGPAENGR